MHKKTFKFLQSVVAFPVMAATLATSPVSGILSKSPIAAVISPESNRPLTSVIAVNQQSDQDAKADADLLIEAQKVDAYLAKYKLPMAGHGLTLVTAAKENDLPPYSIVAIAFVESTAGKFACPNDPNNAFGWNSCRGGKFSSMDEAINTVARTLGGNDPKTAQFYKGKDLEEIFQIYNGRANPAYVKNMNWVMSQIEKQPTPPISNT